MAPLVRHVTHCTHTHISPPPPAWRHPSSHAPIHTDRPTSVNDEWRVRMSRPCSRTCSLRHGLCMRVSVCLPVPLTLAPSALSHGSCSLRRAALSPTVIISSCRAYLIIIAFSSPRTVHTPHHTLPMQMTRIFLKHISTRSLQQAGAGGVRADVPVFLAWASEGDVCIAC